MKRPAIAALLLLSLLPGPPLRADEAADGTARVDPATLSFHRLAVRRFIFSNNIVLSELVPSQTVAFESMHPAFAPSADSKAAADGTFAPVIKNGMLALGPGSEGGQASIYIGGVNPYATYEVEVDSFRAQEAATEVGMEFARLGLRDRVQVISRLRDGRGTVAVRIWRDNKLAREKDYGSFELRGAFILRVQLYGRTLGIFLQEDGVTRYIGHIPVKEHFGGILDFRNIKTAGQCTFNLVSNLTGEVMVKGARSFLSPGIGQADIRLVSYEDLTPCLDGGRLWFTFSCRGIDTPQSVQGILSLDPSVFDVRFEGMIVFDHGDGLLRNDYASHLFYDRGSGEWRAYACDFGGSAGREGRTAPGLVTARSPRDPRKGFSVMKASLADPSSIAGHNEDPCIFYDSTAGKWRLLTSAFVNGDITSRTFESDAWDGTFVPVAPPIKTNSTGTSIQRIGSEYYALMGGHGNLRIHAYPGLEYVADLNLDLQPHWPMPAGRVWASVAPLPEGYPYRYVLLTMDRPNFPGITGPNWSYGALYLYGANP